MTPGHAPPVHRAPTALRLLATLASVLLLPPFILLALAPILLMLIPVAVIGIPFIVPAMLSGTLAARSEARRRAAAPILRLAS